MDRFILASASPRRRELLSAVIQGYEVIPAEGEEAAAGTEPAEVVKELSRCKAKEVAGRLVPCEGDRLIVIGADTVVAVDGEILGKPSDRADAARMIGLLQGRTHHVYTGVTVCCVEAGACDSFSFAEETEVEVYPMNRGEIEGYISLKEPYDKAGAYGIQGAFCVFIRGIRGDYSNVVGLPVARLYHELAERRLL